jgi:hypothetical protein
MRWWREVDGAATRVAARHAGDLKRAIASTLDVDHIVNAYLATHPVNPTPAQAREWAHRNIHADLTPIKKALRVIYADAWVLGKDYARSAYAHSKMGTLRKAPSPAEIRAAFEFDWSKWKPGQEAAAVLVDPPGALRSILEAAQVSSSIFRVNLDRVGSVLAAGIREGAGVAEATSALMQAGILGISGDSVRATMIANTEMNRAMSISAMDTYRELEVGYVEWLTTDPCDYCSENEDAGAIPVGQEFPTGDTEPPAHPNCRCAITPAFPEDGNMTTQNDSEDEDIYLAATPTITKGMPGPLEIARAHSRLEVLPNPNDPDLGRIEKYVQSPWRVVPFPTVDPNAWDTATIQLVKLSELIGTDPYLKRKNVAKHIDGMGQAQSYARSYAMVIEIAEQRIIMDGHHRLMALWLLGLEEVPVWIAKE